MKEQAPTLAIAGLTLLAPVAWGTTYVTVTELLPDSQPLTVAAMRVVPAGIALVAVARARSAWRPRGRRDWSRTAGLAMANFGIFFPLLIVAVYRMPGGVAAAVGGVQPLLVAVFSRLLVGRRPRRIELVVGVIAALGVALVVVRPGAHIDPIGVLSALGANTSFALGVVLTKRSQPPPNRLAATGWQLLIAGVLLTPLALAVDGPPGLPDGRALVGAAHLSLIGTALAFVLWFNGIRRLPTAAPPLLGLAAPITGVALGWLLLDQSLSPVQLTGLVFVVGSIAYGALMPTPSAGPRPATHPTRPASAIA